MVLESLLTPQGALRRPFIMMGLGFIYVTLAVLLSNWVFKDYASLVTVFLVVMALIPLFWQFMESEELFSISASTEKAALVQHGKAIAVFVAIFIGMSAAFALWYLVMTPALFAAQTSTIASLRGGPVGNAFHPGMFVVILQNNLKVLMFCVLFAFIYGAGAIFILAWNASVIGVALGNFIKTGASSVIAQGGMPFLAYAAASGMSLVRYFIHGIPEITAYWVGGLAGGLLSVALVRCHWDRTRMDKVLLDASDLIIVATVILVAAAGIEVFITPLLV